MYRYRIQTAEHPEGAKSPETHRAKRFALVIAMLVMTLMLCACGGGASESGDSSSGSSDVIPEFHSYDLEGNEVDSSIFSQADITVINIWGTFCGPCVQEMPDLAAWDADKPEGVQIIGFVCDVPDMEVTEYADAQEIVAQTGVGYTNIIASGELADYMRNVSLVPTTLFVDSEGKFLHRPFVGADVEGYKDVVKSLMN